jgi:hypothetical protein
MLHENIWLKTYLDAQAARDIIFVASSTMLSSAGQHHQSRTQKAAAHDGRINDQ